MNEYEFRKLFPQASASTIAKNCANAVLSSAKPERTQANALDGSVSGKAESFQRPTVRFILYRIRLLDRDNYAGSAKDLCDGLRHAALIPGDSEAEISLEVQQVKVSKRSDEKTVIVL